MAIASPEGSSGAGATACAAAAWASISRAVSRRRGEGEAARCAWRVMWVGRIPRAASEPAFGANPQATRRAQQRVHARIGKSVMAIQALLGPEEHPPASLAPLRVRRNPSKDKQARH